MGKIKNAISKINFKSKKTLLFIGFFVLAIASSIILISYGYFIDTTPKNLVIGGSAFISDADLTLKIYLEDRDSSGNGLNTYSRAYYIPELYYDYNSALSYCTSGITINSYSTSTHSFSITSSKKGFCKVYFDAQDGHPVGSTFRLFVEQTFGSHDYVEAGQIPTNEYAYMVNAQSYCSDNYAQIQIINTFLQNDVSKQVQVTTSTDVSCMIYADHLPMGSGQYASGTISIGNTSYNTNNSDNWTNWINSANNTGGFSIDSATGIVKNSSNHPITNSIGRVIYGSDYITLGYSYLISSSTLS